MNPHELSKEEVRELFLKKMWDIIDYWARESRAETPRDAISGAVHSILSTLDGCAADLPGFVVAPCPHEDDKEYCIKNGEDWFPQNRDSNVKCDIGGGLHELLYRFDPQR